MNRGVDALIEPFRPLFMQRALVEVLILAIPCGLLGTWVVTRRLAFMTHAIGHATFPALVVAVLAGWSLFGTALVAAIVLALGLGWMSRRTELGGGVAVGIVLAAALALGAVLVSDVRDPGRQANTLLFGSLLGIGWGAVGRTAVLAGVVIVTLAVLGRGLAAGTFHRELAQADGQPLGLIDTVLMVLVAATIAVALNATGSLLVASLLLVPSATARLVTRRVLPMQLTGIGFAALAGVIGLWLAYRLDAPPGAGIAATSAGLFVLVAGVRTAGRFRSRQLAMIPS